MPGQADADAEQHSANDKSRPTVAGKRKAAVPLPASPQDDVDSGETKIADLGRRPTCWTKLKILDNKSATNWFFFFFRQRFLSLSCCFPTL